MVDDHAETMVIPPLEEEPTKKKRKKRGWIIAIVILIVLLVAAFFIGEAVARNYAESYVRSKVTDALQLKAGTPVEVAIAPGSLLFQAATGGIDSIGVGVDDYTVSDITGDLDIRMTEIPLSADAPLKTLRVAFTIPEKEIGGLTSYVSGAENATIDLVDDGISVTSEFTLFGVTIPLGVLVAPIVQDGEVGFKPQTIVVNDSEVSVEDLASGPFGDIAKGVLGGRTFCVASSLPSALTVTDVEVDESSLRVRLEGDGVALGGKEFSKKGACPE